MNSIDIANVRNEKRIVIPAMVFLIAIFATKIT